MAEIVMAENVFKKGVILDLADMVEYSVGGVISKQVIKNNSATLLCFLLIKDRG